MAQPQQNKKKPPKETTRVEVPKAPAGAEVKFSITDLVDKLGDRDHGDWFELEPGVQVQLKGYLPDTTLALYMDAAMLADRHPQTTYRGSRVFILDAVCDEHRDFMESWLNDKGYPGQTLVEIGSRMFQYVCGIPLGEQAEVGSSSTD